MQKSDFETIIPCNSDVGDSRTTILKNFTLERAGPSLLARFSFLSWIRDIVLISHQSWKVSGSMSEHSRSLEGVILFPWQISFCCHCEENLSGIRIVIQKWNLPLERNVNYWENRKNRKNRKPVASCESGSQRGCTRLNQEVVCHSLGYEYIRYQVALYSLFLTEI